MIAFIASEKHSPTSTIGFTARRMTCWERVGYSESNAAYLSSEVARCVCDAFAKSEPTVVDNADFISKLKQIEEAAYVVGAAVQDSGLKAHLRHIGLVAKTLLARLELGAVTVVQAEPKLPEGAVKKPAA